MGHALAGARSRELRKLDHFEVLLLDDLGYIWQGPEEAEVLFTLLGERYQRYAGRSLLLPSSLGSSPWDCVFRDQMATTAAIDRLAYHGVLLELEVTSYRTV